jgi:3-oxoadipate enol-lactonase
MGVSPLGIARRAVYVPWTTIPEGRMVTLAGRGSTYVTDTAGPDPDAPAIVLLHALGCTGLLTWFPAIGALSERFRVITLDQRCHGRGIWTDDLRLTDCADDVDALLDALGIEQAIVAGYSLGSIVAQRVWRQHPARVSGLVLGATTDRFQGNLGERAFFSGMAASLQATRALSRSQRATAAATSAARRLDLLPSDMHEWALREFRSTRPRGIAQALGALGRHHSRPWLGRIDVPTAVVVMTRDRVVPTRRQYALARAIPGATVHEADGGHAGVVLGAERFVPALVEATRTVRARSGDRTR